MICSICGREIPEPRLEVQPSVVTCSRDCSAEHSKRIRRAASDRWRAAQKKKTWPRNRVDKSKAVE